MFENYSKGQYAILKVQERALKLGWSVCVPTVEERFDLVLVDTDGKCHKVQVKFSEQTVTDGSTLIDFRKQTRNNGVTKLYTSAEIDAVIAYISEVEKLIWLGPDKFVGRACLTVRYKPSKNKQTKNVTMVDDVLW